VAMGIDACDEVSLGSVPELPHEARVLEGPPPG
jgi:hypothetical protein